MNEAILEKLEKLFNLSKSDNEHEAAVASQRAAELMARYQLAGVDVEAYLDKKNATPDPEQGRIDDASDQGPNTRMQAWEGNLSAAVARAVGGRAIVWKLGGTAYTITIIGPPGSVGAARYLFMALRREVDRLGRREMRLRGESNAWRRAYCLGMVTRVGERMDEGRRAGFANAGTAMVAVERMDAKIADMFNRLVTKKSAPAKLKRPTALSSGYADGEFVDIGDTGRAKLDAAKKQLKG